MTSLTDDPFASVWDEESLARQRRLLHRVTEIAATKGIALYLDWGTLLGHVRQGGILPWDDDLDLALYDGSRARELGDALADRGLQWWFIGGETFMKVNDPSYPHFQESWTWPFVDIFVFHPQGDALAGSWPTLSLPRNLVLPGRPTRFEGAACWEPEQPLTLLDRMYPGWRIQEVTTSLHHRENRYAESVVLRRIRTDALGRKIDHDPPVLRVTKWMHSRRPCLVMVRLTGQAQYRSWMRQGVPRTWDLLLNDPEDRALDDDLANYIAVGGETKYRAARDLYYADVRIMREREAVLFLDDGIEIAFEDIDRLFQTFLACELWVGQPSWDQTAPAATGLTVCDPRFEAHYTNFVDGVATLFAQSALAACIGSFDQAMSAAELGSHWPKLLSAPFDRVGVIDAVSVRQVGGTAPRGATVDRGAEVLGFVKRSGEVLQKFKTRS